MNEFEAINQLCKAFPRYQADLNNSLDVGKFLYSIATSKTSWNDLDINAYVLLVKKRGLDWVTFISALIYNQGLTDLQLEVVSRMVSGDVKLAAAIRFEKLSRALRSGQRDHELLQDCVRAQVKELHMELLQIEDLPPPVLYLLSTSSNFDNVKMLAQRRILDNDGNENPNANE